MVSTVTETNSLFPVNFYKPLQVTWCSNSHLSLPRVHEREVENYRFQLNPVLVNQPYRKETSNKMIVEHSPFFKNIKGKEGGSSYECLSFSRMMEAQPPAHTTEKTNTKWRQNIKDKYQRQILNADKLGTARVNFSRMPKNWFKTSWLAKQSWSPSIPDKLN